MCTYCLTVKYGKHTDDKYINHGQMVQLDIGCDEPFVMVLISQVPWCEIAMHWVELRPEVTQEIVWPRIPINRKLALIFWTLFFLPLKLRRFSLPGILFHLLPCVLLMCFIVWLLALGSHILVSTRSFQTS